MANPVIRNVTVVYANDRGYKLPNEPAELFIDAFDTDNQVIEVTITVRDASGEAQAIKTVEVLQTDPLTYSATSVNAVVTQDPAMSNHFYVV